MARMALAVLALLALCSLGAAQGPGPTPGPGAGCSMATDKKACGKEKGCLWCESSYGPGSCYDKSQAQYLPKQFFKCKKPKQQATAAVAAADVQAVAVEAAPEEAATGGGGGAAGAVCSMAMDAKACSKEKGCVWCEGSFGPAPGSCLSKDQTKFMPSQFYKCKKPKREVAAEADVATS